MRLLCNVLPNDLIACWPQATRLPSTKQHVGERTLRRVGRQALILVGISRGGDVVCKRVDPHIDATKEKQRISDRAE
jgi:hypothetical protein